MSKLIRLAFPIGIIVLLKACGTREAKQPDNAEATKVNISSPFISAELTLRKMSDQSTHLPLYCWMINPGGKASPLTYRPVTIAEAKAEFADIAKRNSSIAAFAADFFKTVDDKTLVDPKTTATLKVTLGQQLALVKELQTTFQNSKIKSYASKNAICN
jgi:hypothetical protein